MPYVITDEQLWDQLFTQLDYINKKLDRILQKEQQAMALIDDLEAAVTAETTVEQRPITLLGQISAALTAAGTDPVRLQNVVNTINANKDTLAAAVLANTPADLAKPTTDGSASTSKP